MTTLPMLLAAAGIGIGHAILPDHWMPLAVLARTRRYPTRRVLRLSLAAAVTHVLVSAVLGAVLIVVGMRFRDEVARHTDLAVGGVLVATGVVLLVLEVLGRGHGHPHPHGHDRDHDRHHHDGHSHPHQHPHAPADQDHSHAVAVLERPVATTTVATVAEDWPLAADPADMPARAASAAPKPQRRNLLAFLIPFGAAASPDLTILPLVLAAGALGAGPALGVLAAFALATILAIVALTTATALGARRLTAPWIEARANTLTAATLLVIGALVVVGVI